MKHVYLLLFMLIGANGFSQIPEFEFQLYFEDAEGNKDTITLGYDSLATDGIDTIFGEINTIEEPWSSDDFQVMITDGYFASINGNATYRTKKQIIEKHCGESWALWSTIFIDFKNAVFPVKINFDYDAFMQNECVRGSIIETTEPDMLWDILGGYYSNVKDFSSGEIFIDKAEPPGDYYFLPTSDYDFTYCHYQDDDGQTIHTLWFLFYDQYLYPTMDIDKIFLNENSYLVYPIPFDESFYIEEMEGLNNLKIHDVLGNDIYYQQTGNSITPSTTARGIYFVSFTANGKFYTVKTIKR
ncbi:MAG: T9SS type A sorting domain-containing protein [Brumimicrobium sp.]|nr:T9SS type A sorting domain-containing protein [Brumimicrobium sp.]